jgi:hypothetical protein
MVGHSGGYARRKTAAIRRVTAVMLTIALGLAIAQTSTHTVFAATSTTTTPTTTTTTTSTSQAASAVTSRSIAVLLVETSFQQVGVSQSQIANYLVPALNWYHSVSYGVFSFSSAFVGGPVAPADDQPLECNNPAAIGGWAASNFPRSEDIYIVVYPSSWCGSTTPIGSSVPNPNNSSQWFVALPDTLTVHTATPNAEEMYSTMHEVGHALFGGAHANALDCSVAYSQSCYQADSLPLPDVGCAFQSNPEPNVCVYGDPWDVMGDGFPGRQAGGVGTTPGLSWPNGIELSKLGWMHHGLDFTSNGVYQLAPLESSNPGATQVLWLPATSPSGPRVELEYRQPGPTQWLDGYLAGWPQVTSGVLVRAESASGNSQSLLLDTTPGSNNQLAGPGEPYGCPGGTIGNLNINAFCDWYDAALTPGRDVFIGTDHSSSSTYRLQVLTHSASSAQVSVERCPCGSEGCFGVFLNQIQVFDKPDSFRVKPGTPLGFTETISSQNGLACYLSVSDIQTVLGPGFAYTYGSTTGATTADPAITTGPCSGLGPGTTCQTLDWSGSFTVPASSSINLHFGTTAPCIRGVYAVDASASGPDLQFAWRMGSETPGIAVRGNQC